MLGFFIILLLSGLGSVLGQLGQPVWAGVNITAEVLRVQGAISRPTCNATMPCVSFVAWIPTCLKVNGDPACWCPNPDPLHYCALCMSNPTDNTTTPQQTGDATAGHANYHTGCNAYFAFINGTASTTSAAPSSTSSTIPTPTSLPAKTGSSISTGSLVGAILGGIIAILIVGVGAFLIYKHMQNKHDEKVAATRNSFYPSDYDFKPGGPSPRMMPIPGPQPGMQNGMHGMMGFHPYGGNGPSADAPQVMTPIPQYSATQPNRESMMSGDIRSAGDQR